jgi:phosphate transport system substrate-binding protein
MIMNSFKKISLIIGLTLASPLLFAEEIDISGAGATFPAPIYIRWAEIYEKIEHIRINYQAIGSGGGIQQIIAGTVHFGATDKPLTQEQLSKNHLIQFPTLLGAVVPVYHIPEIKAPIKMTGEILADIFMGKISVWNDARIQTLNPDIALPNKKITVIHRSDGSGTSFLFTHYLSQVSHAWKKSIGSDVYVQWPIGLGGKGNDGIVVFVKQIPYSVGYVEYSYVLTHHLQYPLLENAAHHFIEPSIDSIKAAAENANWQDPFLILTNQNMPNAWPITGATFILMKDQAHALNPKENIAILKFFSWGFKHGNNEAIKLNFVPLPNTVIDFIKDEWHKQFKYEIKLESKK